MTNIFCGMECLAPRVARGRVGDTSSGMTAIGAYCRVSSKAQNVATQRSAIERCASARGDTITSWYTEKLSGKTLARPRAGAAACGRARGRRPEALPVAPGPARPLGNPRHTFEVVEQAAPHDAEPSAPRIRPGRAKERAQGPRARDQRPAQSWTGKRTAVTFHCKIPVR